MLELLNQQFLQTRYFDIIKTVLERHYTTRDNLNPMISYSEFKDIIIGFVQKNMEILLENTKYKNDRFSCTIKKMRSDVKGDFNPKNNKITIDENVIINLYNGDLEEMLTIFHELNHFKILYELKLGTINQDIVRIAKEKLLDIANKELLKDKSDIKHGIERINYYYEYNYYLYSEEKFVNIESVKNFIQFLDLCNIKLSKYEMLELNKIIITNQSEYENYIRDVSYNFYFNDRKINFEEAFDLMIRHKNQEWIEVPQIQIEYYKDSMGNIKKRTNDELRELLESETEPDKRMYIEELLMKNIRKNLNECDDKKSKNIGMISNEINNKTK